jgi:hypothetical protein
MLIHPLHSSLDETAKRPSDSSLLWLSVFICFRLRMKRSGYSSRDATDGFDLAMNIMTYSPGKKLDVFLK